MPWCCESSGLIRRGHLPVLCPVSPAVLPNQSVMRCRYNLQSYDYRIGRAMFETTKAPASWLTATALMDEIWVCVVAMGLGACGCHGHFA